MIAAAHDLAALSAQSKSAVTTLRLVRDEAKESGKQLRRALDAHDEDTSPQRVVLVIEDREDLAGITAETLAAGLDVEVHVAHTYHDARRLAPALPWMCVLLDLHLSDPEGTGVDVLRVIPRTTPVVIVTGRLEEPELQRLARRARCGYFVKGSRRNLVDVVRAAIRDHGGDL